MRKFKLINDKIDNISDMLKSLDQGFYQEMRGLYHQQDLCQKIIKINNDNNVATAKMREENTKIIESLIKQYYADRKCFDAAMVAPKSHVPILINHGETIKMDRVESFNISWNRKDGFHIDVEYK